MVIPEFFPKCIKCDRTCLTCKGEESTDCVTCDPALNRLAAPDLLGRCACIDRFFDPLAVDKKCV
jgi:hypothetical protein